jgi:ABC-type lipoprotein export system ATPase subunit
LLGYAPRRSSGLDNNLILRTESLSKTYVNGPEKTVALDDVNLNVRRGELLAIYGPSGSGKTTLLFLLGGLDRPTSGQIFLDSLEISNLDERRLSKLRRSEVGFVFQNYNLVEDLTVLENVKLTMMFEGKSEQEMAQRASDVLRKVGVAHKEKNRPSQLSAGEQQRVATARALANRPRLVLMDEPTGNLDQDNSRGLMNLIEEIRIAEGVTFIVATHNQEIVQATASNVFLKGGRIVNDSSTSSALGD